MAALYGRSLAEKRSGNCSGSRAGCLVCGSQAIHLPLQLTRSETAMDVTFQMSNGCLLAGNHMFHEVTDRDHADHIVTIKHGQMANVLVCHEAQTCFHSLAPMRREHIR